jgi:hypothetical protein
MTIGIGGRSIRHFVLRHQHHIGNQCCRLLLIVFWSYNWHQQLIFQDILAQNRLEIDEFMAMVVTGGPSLTKELYNVS